MEGSSSPLFFHLSVIFQNVAGLISITKPTKVNRISIMAVAYSSSIYRFIHRAGLFLRNRLPIYVRLSGFGKAALAVLAAPC